MACQAGSFEVDQFDGRIGIDRFGAQNVSLFDVGRCHCHQERAVVDREVDRATQSVFVTCFSGVDEEVIAAGADHFQARIYRGQAFRRDVFAADGQDQASARLVLVVEDGASAERVFPP